MSTAHPYSLEQIDANWQAVDKATLIFVVQDNTVLLIRKKRGLGAGKINGPGGKHESGESAQQCAHREIKEELCIDVAQSTNAGRLRFQFIDAYSIDVQVFITTDYQGTPTETEEAVPLWFQIQDIPYDQMWADDRIWLPRVLAGESVDGRFIFDDDKLLEHSVVSVSCRQLACLYHLPTTLNLALASRRLLCH